VLTWTVYKKVMSKNIYYGYFKIMQ
jgi:hypothetical protein